MRTQDAIEYILNHPEETTFMVNGVEVESSDAIEYLSTCSFDDVFGMIEATDITPTKFTQF